MASWLSWLSRYFSANGEGLARDGFCRGDFQEASDKSGAKRQRLLYRATAKTSGVACHVVSLVGTSLSFAILFHVFIAAVCVTGDKWTGPTKPNFGESSTTFHRQYINPRPGEILSPPTLHCPLSIESAESFLISWPATVKSAIATQVMKFCGKAHAAPELSTLCPNGQPTCTLGEEALISSPLPGDTRPFAIFDMDNTVVVNDVEEALMEYLEKRGILTPETINESLKIVPFEPNETVKAYYDRMTKRDIMVSYPWAGQVFSGLTVKELTKYVRKLFDKKDSIEYPLMVPRPRVSHGMQQLFSLLRAAKIDIYVITAAHEEIGRFIMSNPEFGYEVPPDNVFGLNTLLENPKTGELRRIAELRRLDIDYRKFTLTSQLAAPFPWMAGKHATMLSSISSVNKPVIVAGDSVSSDWNLLYNSYAPGTTLRLFMYSDATNSADSVVLKRLRKRICSTAAHERYLGYKNHASNDWHFINAFDVAAITK